MNITNVKYTEHGDISATIDGQEFTMPDQAGNRYRQMIAEWESEGNTIAAYVAPVEPRRSIGTFMEFREVLTEGESDAITGAAMTVLPIKKWYDLAVATNSIDLESDVVIQGMAAFVANGLMTEERKAVVLATDFDD